jgi:hypothetical protein
MPTTLTSWLASGLVQLTTPSPWLAPADVEATLGEAFRADFTGRALVDELVAEVRRQSSGEVTLENADPTAFSPELRVRGPAAYLVATRTRYLVLGPNTGDPVRFDSPRPR